MATDENIWLAGNLGPVSEELTLKDLPVSGEIPAELDGRYLRNGPNPIDAGDLATYHWFSGTGMVHGLRLSDGAVQWYRNRYVRSPESAGELDEPAPPNPFGDEVRVFAANTNVIGHAGRTFAIVEAGSPPIELSDELDTLGVCDFDGTLEHPFSAHPKRDPLTGELHVAAYFWGWGDRIRYLVVDAEGRVRRNVDVDVAAPGSPMVHDIAITQKYALLFDMPVTFDLDLAMSGARLPYRWNPDHGARVGLLPRSGDAQDVTWHEVEPCFVFHPMNAYDDGDRVVVDVVRHPQMFASHLLGPAEGPSRLDRWTIDRDATTVAEETLCDRSVEFPRHDERRLGSEYRFGYSAQALFPDGYGSAFKHDLVTGTTEERDFGPGRSTAEPVFVPAADDSAEDDGYLMAFVYDATTERSDLEIWHAQDFGGPALAQVHLPARVPMGFHGNWVPTP